MEKLSSQCKVWTKHLDKDGYARTSRGGKKVFLHKFSFEEKYGLIKKRYVLDHLCKNRACFNPDHLEAVTQKVNVRRGCRPKLSLEIANRIKNIYKKGLIRQIDLAKNFNIDQSVISRIINERAWI